MTLTVTCTVLQFRESDSRAYYFVIICGLNESEMLFWGVHLSYHTTHTTTAERRAEEQCRRRGASSGHKTKRGIEGEDTAAAGIERFVYKLVTERSDTDSGNTTSAPRGGEKAKRLCAGPSRP